MTEWFHTTRYVYNKTVKSIKDGEKINFQSLRNKIVTAKNNDSVKDWELKTPKDIRAGAIRDLVKGYKTAITNLKRKNIPKFNLRYRTKKRNYSIEIPKTAVSLKDKKFTIYKRYNSSPIKSSKDKYLKNLEINHDCRLKHENGRWYLIIPCMMKNKSFKAKGKCCALDPGIRKFQTVFSENETIKIEVKKHLIKKLYLKLDSLRSLRDKKTIKKSSFRKAWNRLIFRSNNLIDDMHHQTISYLTSKYKTIFLPSFESQEIGKVVKSRKIKRNLFHFKHYTFKQRLIDKGKQIRDCNVVICSEEYTSKTCGRCGILNDVGNSEIFKCKECSLVIDRDINGARNIFLKNMKK